MQVIVKILQPFDIPNYPKTEEARDHMKRRLAREMGVWKQLEHPNILRLEGYALIDDYHALITPFAPYGDASAYLGRNPFADRKRIVRLPVICPTNLKLIISFYKILDVIDALTYLHSYGRGGTAHGDLKPVSPATLL